MKMSVGRKGENGRCTNRRAHTCNTNADGWQENTQYFAYVLICMSRDK